MRRLRPRRGSMTPYAQIVTSSPTREASPLGLPNTLPPPREALRRDLAVAVVKAGSRAPFQRRAPFAWLARSRVSWFFEIPCRVQMTVRKAAVAGSWYPGSADVLTAAVDQHVASPG